MHYFKEEIGNNIRKERLKLNWSQSTLGKEIGVVGKQISNYEKGITIPPIETLFELCDIFNCELGYLLGEKKYSYGTMTDTIICETTGLNHDALKSILITTGTSSDCLDYGFNSDKYKKILNNILTNNYFHIFLKNLLELDELHCAKEQQKNVFERLHNELGKPLFDKALNIILNDICINNHTLSSEECEAIKKTNNLIDEGFSFKEQYEQKEKYYRFVLQENLTLLLNTMYPSD